MDNSLYITGLDSAYLDHKNHTLARLPLRGKLAAGVSNESMLWSKVYKVATMKAVYSFMKDMLKL